MAAAPVQVPVCHWTVMTVMVTTASTHPVPSAEAGPGTIHCWPSGQAQQRDVAGDEPGAGRVELSRGVPMFHASNASIAQTAAPNGGPGTTINPSTRQPAACRTPAWSP